MPVDSRMTFALGEQRCAKLELQFSSLIGMRVA
jgi:hypothetical protein